MEEKILKAKAGMPCLILFIFLYLAAIASIIFGGNLLSKQNNLGAVFLTIGIIWVSIGFVPFLGLKIIKPQEALVLTLFGNYIGTLKEAGFFFVNPFAVAVNPAAKTRLGQSDDVSHIPSIKLEAGINLQNNYVSKKISLKVMTLNNKKQKINDALGNPIEIGIAVIWRVVDTAKAVFNVDNYKEYLSLQCDGALRKLSVCILMTLVWLRIMALTGKLMNLAFVVPVRKWHNGFVRRYRLKSKMQALRF